MSKRLPYTPNSRITSALRQLWLRSRERAATIKRDDNTCSCCGRKGSKAKGKEVSTHVHHKKSINWKKIIKVVRKELLADPKHLEVMCVDCHKEVSSKQRQEKKEK